MQGEPLFRFRECAKKALNTFLPHLVWRLSPSRMWQQRHWEEQDAGDIHGYDQYDQYNPRIRILLDEMAGRVTKDALILDLGCNCGFYLNELRNEGYSRLTGIDISVNAIRYGQKTFNFTDRELITGSFEQVLPQIAARGERFDLIYSMGATLELVHPSFDVIRHICAITDGPVILIISEWGHAYPRFWEYEFSRYGFRCVKAVRPFSGNAPGADAAREDSLLVFQKVRARTGSPA